MEQRCFKKITPEGKEKEIIETNSQKSGMKILDFKLLLLSYNQEYEDNSADSEIFLVILGGQCSVEINNAKFDNIGKRKDVFDGKPFSVYIPPKSKFHIFTNETQKVEIALAIARVSENVSIEPYLIKPENVKTGKWGISNYSRNYHLIAVDEEHPAIKLMIGETYTPSGNWSTYPPHKHEKDAFPSEIFLEEIYYYKVDHPNGWGLARHYDDREMNNIYLITDNTIQFIPKGYHTVVAAPGFTVYYLWFLAGNYRKQVPVVDPSLKFIDMATKMIRNIEENLSI